MKTTEIIEKVKQNLKIQENLKEELDFDDALRQMTEAKLAVAQERLLAAEQDEIVLKDNLVQDLKNGAEALNTNLSLKERFAYVDENMFGYGMNFSFVGKNYDLLAHDYDMMSEQKVLNVADFVNKLFEDYIIKGKVIFNEESFKALSEIKRLYDVKPEVVTNKLVSMDIERKVKKLQKNLMAKKEQLDENVSELKYVDAKLSKTKEFKSKFLNKVFTKKAQLEEKRAGILISNNKLHKEIADIESTLADKASMRLASVDYIQEELNCLYNIFEWVVCFEASKLELVKFEEFIQEAKRGIQELEEGCADIQTRMKENKGILQLNRRINNEIVTNAFMNTEFVDGLKSLDSAKVDKEDYSAVKFVENKYNDYLQNCVEKIVK